MGRLNRSRKRRNAMDRIKRVRYAAKELIQLKKTLGLIDENGKELLAKMEEVVEIKTAEQLKEEQEEAEKVELLAELDEKLDKGEDVHVVNENSKKEHVYNTKTMRDQFGSYPPWFNPRKTDRKIRKKQHARKRNFRQNWQTGLVPI